MHLSDIFMFILLSFLCIYILLMFRFHQQNLFWIMGVSIFTFLLLALPFVQKTHPLHMQNDGTSVNSVQLLWNDLGFSSHTHKILLHNHTNLYTCHRFSELLFREIFQIHSHFIPAVQHMPCWEHLLFTTMTCVFVSLWLCLDPLLPSCQSLSVCLCPHLHLFVSLLVSLFFSVSVCLPASQPASQSSAPFWSLPVCLSVLPSLFFF